MLEKYLSMKQKYLELKTKQAGKSVDQFTFKNIDFSKYLPYLFMMFDGLLYEYYGSHLSISNDYLKVFTQKITRKIKNSLLSKILNDFQTNLKLTTSLKFAKKNFFCDWSSKKQISINFLKVLATSISNNRKMYNSVKSGPIVLDYSTPTHQIMLVVNVSNKTITIVNSGSGLENHESCGALYNLWKTYKVENNFNDFLGILRIFKECVDKQIENQYITRITFPKISWNENTLNYQNIVDNMKYVLNSMRPCNENNSIFLSFIYNLIYDFNQLRPTGSRIKTCSAFTFEKDTGQNIANNLNDTFNSLYAQYSITFFKFQKIEYAQLSNNEYTFYTNAQKSGSCSWFSLLWSLFLFIIHQTQDKKIEIIIIIINTFFTEFAGYLNDTKKELFKKNYIYNSFDCYHVIDLLYKYNVKDISIQPFHEIFKHKNQIIKHWGTGALNVEYYELSDEFTKNNQYFTHTTLLFKLESILLSSTEVKKVSEDKLLDNIYIVICKTVDTSSTFGFTETPSTLLDRFSVENIKSFCTLIDLNKNKFEEDTNLIKLFYNSNDTHDINSFVKFYTYHNYKKCSLHYEKVASVWSLLDFYNEKYVTLSKCIINLYFNLGNSSSVTVTGIETLLCMIYNDDVYMCLFDNRAELKYQLLKYYAYLLRDFAYSSHQFIPFFIYSETIFIDQYRSMGPHQDEQFRLIYSNDLEEYMLEDLINSTIQSTKDTIQENLNREYTKIYNNNSATDDRVDIKNNKLNFKSNEYNYEINMTLNGFTASLPDNTYFFMQTNPNTKKIIGISKLKKIRTIWFNAMLAT